MTDNIAVAYEPPTITEIASLHELTLTTYKHSTNTPDGIEYLPPTGAPVLLTS